MSGNTYSGEDPPATGIRDIIINDCPDSWFSQDFLPHHFQYGGTSELFEGNHGTDGVTRQSEMRHRPLLPASRLFHDSEGKRFPWLHTNRPEANLPTLC